MILSFDQRCFKEKEVLKPKYVFEWFDVGSEEDTEFTEDLQFPPIPSGNNWVGEAVLERDLVDKGINQNIHVGEDVEGNITPQERTREISEVGDTASECNTSEESAENEGKGLRRSTRERKPPMRYACCEQVGSDWLDMEIPTNVFEALESDLAEEWKNAMLTELENLRYQNTFEVVERPQGQNVIGSKWVFNLKESANGLPPRFKACLVAQGFRQKYGIDFVETSSPVVQKSTLRVLFAMAVENSRELAQLDSLGAYLNIYLRETVYRTTSWL